MNRREFITLLGGAAAWPIGGRAQQPPLPVIGWLSPSSRAADSRTLDLIRNGLGAHGYAEGHNVIIEYRWAEGRYERMPVLAADLVRLGAKIMIANTGTVAVPAALAASPTTPIIFLSGVDPILVGLVPRLNRPGSNITGVVTLTSNMASKQLGLVRELLPSATRLAILTNPKNPGAADVWATDAQSAARSIGIELLTLNAASVEDIDQSFASLLQARADALLIAPDPFLTSRAGQIITLAARHGFPVLYGRSEHARAGGLMSYSANRDDLVRTIGAYAARILKGEKAGDLPVQQPTKFEFVINLTTAKVLGLAVPPTLIARADEIIE